MVKMTISRKKNQFLREYDRFVVWRDTQNNDLLYSVCFFFFYRDYFINKIVTKIMRNGKKEVSFFLFRMSLFFLKSFFGFQPFFFFKHIAFGLRQLFTIQTKLIRKIKLYTLPLLLSPVNQLNYGINHIIKCSRQLVKDEKLHFSYAFFVILLNCFLYSRFKAKKSDVHFT